MAVVRVGHQKKERLLEAYARLGTLTQSCIAAGIARQTHYNWLKADPEYAQAFVHAEEAVADMLEAEAVRRAVDGSDTLLIFLLKGHRPEKFKDRMHVKSEAEVTVHDGDSDFDREIAGLMAQLAARSEGGASLASDGPGESAAT